MKRVVAGAEKVLVSRNNAMKPVPPSPCIGICSTVYGDDFCRGCKREYREVINWNTLTAEQQQIILDRLQQQMEMVLPEFLTIINIDLLLKQFDQVALRPAIHPSHWCKVHELLRLKAETIQNLRDYGLQARDQYQALSANELFTIIDDKLYDLAQN